MLPRLYLLRLQVLALSLHDRNDMSFKFHVHEHLLSLLNLLSHHLLDLRKVWTLCMKGMNRGLWSA